MDNSHTLSQSVSTWPVSCPVWVCTVLQIWLSFVTSQLYFSTKFQIWNGLHSPQKIHPLHNAIQFYPWNQNKKASTVTEIIYNFFFSFRLFFYLFKSSSTKRCSSVDSELTNSCLVSPPSKYLHFAIAANWPNRGTLPTVIVSNCQSSIFLDYLSTLIHSHTLGYEFFPMFFFFIIVHKKSPRRRHRPALVAILFQRGGAQKHATAAERTILLVYGYQFVIQECRNLISAAYHPEMPRNLTTAPSWSSHVCDP